MPPESGRQNEARPPYVQCICPKHGPTTWLHRDAETDDFCLLPAIDARKVDG